MQVLQLHNPRLLEWLQAELLGQWFKQPVEYYNGLDLLTYRALVTQATDFINDMNFAHLLLGDLKEEVCETLQTKDLMLQNGLYLRAARPVKAKQESVGWHRESFYGANEHEFNFWMPISGVTPENSPKYIPGSDKIPDEDIIFEKIDTDMMVKNARIGLIRNSAVIQSGVDLTSPAHFEVPYGSVLLFPGALIHGAAENDTKRIRLSVDMRVVAKEHIAPNRGYVELVQ